MQNRQLGVLVGAALLVMVGAFGAFLVVTHGVPTVLDASVADTVAGLRSPTVTRVVSDVTMLFGPLAVTAWTVIAVVALIVHDRAIQRAVMLAATVGMAGLVGEALKLAVHRPRPPVFDQIGAAETTYSYPSGHVTGTTAFVVAVALIIMAHRRRTARVGVATAAFAIAALCGFTRLYLGVHWFTDVIAGLCVGIAVALVAPAAASWAIDRLRPYLPERFVTAALPPV